MTASKDLSIDFETCSLVDLRRTGVHTYAEHSSTRVILMSYAWGDDPVQRWTIGQPFPKAVLDHVRAGRTVSGWNAGFEWVIWNKTLIRQLGLDPVADALALSQVEDTMAAAAFWGLPLSLDMAAPAAGSSVHKDKEGHALMMRMCKPRRFNPITGDVAWWHEDDPARLDRLGDYCDNDVETERGIKNSVLKLPGVERQVWMLDQMMNARGVGVDYDLVVKLQELAERAAERANDELKRMTNGQVSSINAHAALLEWLQFHGYPHDNLRKPTVAARLDDPDCKGMERAGLELRADAARTSAAKLKAMLDACPERVETGTVRGMLQYYGANRTGRWAGRLIQLQNMPRGDFKDVDGAIRAVLAGMPYDMLEACFGPGMGIVSTLLRGCIVARKGKKLVVADFSQIEARMVAWLAGQDDILAIFRSGADVYRYTAGKVTGQDWTQIPKESPLRQLGKVLVLACGFGMGGPKFRDTAEQSKVFLTEDEAKANVRAWRDANPMIVKFWWDLDAAVRTALEHPGQTVRAGAHIKVGMWGPHLVVRLPSGRPLVYREARLIPSKDRPGQTEISYMGVNQYTRKWERIRTYGGKLAENVTQAAARDVMRDAMVQADKEGIPCILTVHDELITEPDDASADATLTRLLGIMHQPPAWAPGLPVAGEGWAGDRYKK